jgi:hypothetical protein
MIIDDLDVCRVAVLPAKAHAPLIVDPDRVLPGAISAECFEPKARRLEIVKRTDLVEECEPALRGALKFRIIRVAEYAQRSTSRAMPPAPLSLTVRCIVAML